MPSLSRIIEENVSPYNICPFVWKLQLCLLRFVVTLCDCFRAVYKKHYPPALDDEVWRLEKIGKDGSFHKRLNKAGIHKVEDFLRLVVRDSQRLRNVRFLNLTSWRNRMINLVVY